MTGCGLGQRPSSRSASSTSLSTRSSQHSLPSSSTSSPGESRSGASSWSSPHALNARDISSPIPAVRSPSSTLPMLLAVWSLHCTAAAPAPRMLVRLGGEGGWGGISAVVYSTQGTRGTGGGSLASKLHGSLLLLWRDAVAALLVLAWGSGPSSCSSAASSPARPCCGSGGECLAWTTCSAWPVPTTGHIHAYAGSLVLTHRWLAAVSSSTATNPLRMSMSRKCR